MAALSVESIATLRQSLALLQEALKTAGLPADESNIAVKTLLDKIARAQNNERDWLVKLEEIPALLNAKIRRVRSTADAERSYDHDKLRSELPTIIAMLQHIASIKPEEYIAPNKAKDEAAA